MRNILALVIVLLSYTIQAQNLQDRIVKQSYTSALISAKLGGITDVPAFDRGLPPNRGTRLDKWFYEPLKDRHYLKLIGGQGRTFYAHVGGEDCLRVSILRYEAPTTTIPVAVSTEAELIAALANLQSNTTLWIAAGTYRLQQPKQHQNIFTRLNNIKIIGNGVTISGFKTEATTTVQSHQTQAFGLKDGMWRRMNPRHPSGPGAMYTTSIQWTNEVLAAESNVLGYTVNPDGTLLHNASGPIKLSNELSPQLWKFVECENVLIQGITFEGYNSTYPNSSAIGCIAELQGCSNIKFHRCSFNNNGSAIISALNTQKINKLIWLDQCKIEDENDEFPYLAIRHSGHTRTAGTVYFSNTQNCSITNTQFIGVFMPVLDINSTNLDIASNYFERCRNICTSLHGSTGYGLGVWKNTYHKCGNPLPSNEEMGQFGPTFWFNNIATESGWNGTAEVLKYKGTSSGIAQGNRLGGLSIPKALGGIHLYDNNIEVTGIDSPVDTITTVGLQLANHPFSRLDAIGNTWKLTNTGPRTANVVRHFEVGGKTEHYANNLKTITWKENTLEWDRTDQKMVFFGMQYLTNEEFTALLQAGK